MEEKIQVIGEAGYISDRGWRRGCCGCRVSTKAKRINRQAIFLYNYSAVTIPGMMGF
jgi:hypothetical protein